MRINARTTGLMADSEAETGVGTRSGSTLDPARMTAAERKALRDATAAETKRLKEEAEKKAQQEAREKRMAELKAEREDRVAQKAEERALSNPMLDPTNRPDAPPADDDYVYYYSWIGGVSTGQWKLYRERKDSPKAAVAEARAEGGPTTATFSSSVGANTLASNIPGSAATGGTPTGGSTTGGSTASKGPAVSTKDNGDGTVTYTYADGSTATAFKSSGSTTGGSTAGSTTGGTAGATTSETYTAPDGRIFTDLNAYNTYIAQTKLDEKRAAGQSAYNLLFEEFNRYGLGALVEPLKGFITDGLSPAEFTLRLRDTNAYKKRFAANQARIQKGLTALDEATYIGLEDQYQEIMRKYGMPESYYTRGDMGRQEGFEKFIANDVAPTELEDRIATAQNRIVYANPEVGIALRTFYPDITNGDLLAYALDPEKALAQIKRRITAAEIGASAVQLGLATNVTDAEYLARYGVTKDQAQAGFRNVAEVLPRSSQLGDIYAKQGMGPYTQETATQEFFNVPGAAEAAQKRRRLAQLETAQFSGEAGVAQGALARERAGQF